MKKEIKTKMRKWIQDPKNEDDLFQIIDFWEDLGTTPMNAWCKLLDPQLENGSITHAEQDTYAHFIARIAKDTLLKRGYTWGEYI